jgi:hypothetical protein
VSEADQRTPPPRSLAVAALAAPPIAIVVLALLLAFSGGGIDPALWTRYAIAIPAGLGVLALAGAVPTVPRRAVPALIAAGGFAAWSILSLAWSQAPGATTGTALRTLLIVTAFAVGAIYAGRESSALALCGAIGLSGAVVAVAVLLELVSGDTGIFAFSRLAWPIAYSDGVAALLFLPAPILLLFASATGVRPVVRGIVAGLAGLELATGLLSQSRGGTASVVLSFGVAILLGRDRTATAITALSILVPLAVASPVLAHPETATSGDLHALAIRVTLVALVAGAAVWVVATWQWRVGISRRATRATALTWAVILALGAAAFVVRAGSPVSYVQARWSEFAHIDRPAADHATRLASGASNRYEYWRVSLIVAGDHPLTGVGAGAFAVPWYRERHVDESVNDAHSLLFGTLAELGLPGVILLLLALGLPLLRRARSAATPFLASASAYALLHASVDWSLTVPALALPAMLVFGAGCAGRDGSRRTLAGRRTRAIIVAGTLATVVLAVPVYVAAQRMAQADVVAGVNPGAAIKYSRSAARFSPLDAAPDIQGSAIAALADRPRESLALARSAVAREPDSWEAWVRLRSAAQGLGLATLAGSADGELARLNPRLPLVARDHPWPGSPVVPSKCLADPHPIQPDGSYAFAEYATLGVRTWVRPMSWAEIALRRPTNPTDPRDPAYVWPAAFDQEISAAVAAGIEPVLYITGAPPWANGGRIRFYAPKDPNDFANFAAAAVRRYPQVRRWQIWSEPTRSNSFRPQGGNGLTAPRLYARILDAAYGAIHAVRADAVVIGGNMHPNGRNDEGTTAPATFLQNMRLPDGRPPRLDLFGINPYSERPPDLQLPLRPGRLDINDLDWLVRNIDLIWPSHPRLFIGEFGWLTEHGNNGWYWHVSRRQQAADLTAAYKLATFLGHVDTFCWFLLRDRPETSTTVDGTKVYTNWTSGLELSDGTHKPSYDAFRAVPSGPVRLRR